MTINLTLPQTTQELRPKITVVGVGGAGCNAVNNMIDADLNGVEFLVANTDGQALAHSRAPRKIQLGKDATKGLGAGSKPEIGRLAAEESLEEVMRELEDSNMIFITAGMGGGTGTGAASVIAQAARDRGILTVGVVTKPFAFEGHRRMLQADEGIKALQAHVDTLIVIPNQNLFRLANERTTFAEAFHMADAVLNQGVSGVTDLMLKPGLINLDFADIRSVMTEMGKAMMGTGEAAGENRANEAAEAAINNPLLDDTSMRGARAVLINITGGHDMSLFEVDEAANRVKQEVDQDALIIFGSAFDENLDGILRVSVVATGIDTAIARDTLPFDLQSSDKQSGYAQSNLHIPTPDLPEQAAPVANAFEQGPVEDTAEGAPDSQSDSDAVIELEEIVEAGDAGVRAASNKHRSEMIFEEAGEDAPPETSEQPILHAGEQAAVSEPISGEPSSVFIPHQSVDLEPDVRAPEIEDAPQAAKQGSLITRLSGLWAPKPHAELAEPQEKPPEQTHKEQAYKEQAYKTGPISPLVDLPRADTQQPSLAITSSDGDDNGTDELEIPAFLRRQAN